MVQVVDHLGVLSRRASPLQRVQTIQSSVLFIVLVSIGIYNIGTWVIMMEQSVVECDGQGTRWFWMFSFC